MDQLSAPLPDGVGKREGAKIRTDLLREVTRITQNLAHLETLFSESAVAVADELQTELSVFATRLVSEASTSKHVDALLATSHNLLSGKTPTEPEPE